MEKNRVKLGIEERENGSVEVCMEGNPLDVVVNFYRLAAVMCGKLGVDPEKLAANLPGGISIARQEISKMTEVNLSALETLRKRRDQQEA